MVVDIIGFSVACLGFLIALFMFVLSAILAHKDRLGCVTIYAVFMSLVTLGMLAMCILDGLHKLFNIGPGGLFR